MAVARVVADPSGLHIRTIFGTRRYVWDDVLICSYRERRSGSRGAEYLSDCLGIDTRFNTLEFTPSLFTNLDDLEETARYYIQQSRATRTTSS